MPQVQGVDDELRQEYFNSYIDTYLMRDATEAGGITDAVRFRKFLVGCASLVSEQLNDSTPEVKTTLTQMKRGLTNAHYSCSI